MEFNVWKEAWIPVKTVAGNLETVSMHDLYENADSCLEICGDNAMEEYAIYRFVNLFATCVYRPTDEEMLLDLYERGKFDIQCFERYVAECEAEGVSFDLFDSERPFLQARKDKGLDDEKSIKSIACLDYTRPSGNNHIHFEHTAEKDVSVSVEKALILLLTSQVFCTAGTQGPSNVYGAPPLFWIIKGASLFETVLFSMPIIKEIDEKEKRELWRNERRIVPNQEIAEVTLLEGLFFPARRIRLSEENGIVKKCMLQKGLNFVGYDSWRDPYVVYVFGKNGRSSLKPSSEKMPWRNLASISDDFGKQITTLIKQYDNVFREEIEKSYINLLIYGVETSNASYLEVMKGELELNLSIMLDQEKADVMFAGLKKAEDTIGMVHKILKEYWKNNSLVGNCIRCCYAECERLFPSFLCKELEKADTKDALEQVKSEWSERVNEIVRNQFRLFCKQVDSDIASMIQIEKAKRRLYFLYGRKGETK